MIFLKSIELQIFKGIGRLTCDFDDLTLLAGLNNSGKTSVLQAIYLLASILRPLADHPHLAHPEQQHRTVDLNVPINRLGLPSFDWLLQGPETPFVVSGTFFNGCIVRIEMFGRGRFCFTATSESGPTDPEATKTLLQTLQPLTAEFFRPPGMLSSREAMVSGDQYRNFVTQGQGNLYWRNSIWWNIQGGGGPESFEPVRQLVQRHFPNVKLHHPTLGVEGQPPILIKYEEPNRPPLDIAQSGAGLHTFLSLAQLIEQSSASFVLLDEPDSHLHASQQALALDLLTDVALGDTRQVVIATHSPELIARVPPESIRWLQPGNEHAEGGVQTATLLDRLGAAPNVYLSKTDFPQVILYVEGNQDKPIIEALLDWCMKKSAHPLPKTQVVRHKDGKFNAVALQAIARTAAEMQVRTRVVGIRDLDWDYSDCEHLPPPEESQQRAGNGYVLVTLMCKELENLLCDPDFLYDVLEHKIAKEEIREILNAESLTEELVKPWQHHAEPQIRERFDAKEVDHTKEMKGEGEFLAWKDNENLRLRLVSGKSLLARFRNRLQKDHGLRVASIARIFRGASKLPKNWTEIARAIFPELQLE